MRGQSRDADYHDEARDAQISGNQRYPKLFPPVSEVRGIREPLDFTSCSGRAIVIQKSMASTGGSYLMREKVKNERESGAESPRNVEKFLLRERQEKHCLDKQNDVNLSNKKQHLIALNQDIGENSAPNFEEGARLETTKLLQKATKRVAKQKAVTSAGSKAEAKEDCLNAARETLDASSREMSRKNYEKTSMEKSTMYSSCSNGDSNCSYNVKEVSSTTIGDFDNETPKMERGLELSEATNDNLQCKTCNDEKYGPPNADRYAVNASNQVCDVSRVMKRSDCIGHSDPMSIVDIANDETTTKDVSGVPKCTENLEPFQDTEITAGDQVNPKGSPSKNAAGKEDCKINGTLKKMEEETKIILTKEKQELSHLIQNVIEGMNKKVENIDQKKMFRKSSSCDDGSRGQENNVSEIQQNGSSFVTVGDISIIFGDKEATNVGEKLNGSACEKEILEKITEISEHFPVHEKNVGGREIPTNEALQMNQELMKELKKACIESNDLELKVEQWRNKYDEIKIQLKQACQIGALKKDENQSLVLEKNVLEGELDAAKKHLKSIEQQLGKRDEEVSVGKEKITLLESLLREKQMAMEEMIRIEGNGVQDICDNTEMSRNFVDDIIKERKTTCSRSIFGCFPTPMKKNKDTKGRKLSKKKKMKLMIGKLDDEILDLRNKLSNEKKQRSLLVMFREESDKQIRIYKNKAIMNETALQKARQEFEEVKKKLEKERKCLKNKLNHIAKEKDNFSQRNDECSKELAAVKKELENKNWQLQFENSYNAEIEEKVQSCIRLMEQRKQNEKMKHEESVKMFTIKFEEKQNQMRKLEKQLTVEKKSNEALKKRLEEAARKKKDDLVPEIRGLVKGMKADFMKMINEHGNGKTSNATILESLGNLGEQVGKLLGSQREQFQKKVKDRMGIDDANERKETNSYIAQKVELRSKLSLNEEKCEGLEKEMKEMVKKYEECMDENKDLKRCKRVTESEMEKLNKENEKLISRLCNFDKNMNNNQNHADLENDLKTAKKEIIKLKRSVKEALGQLEMSKNDKKQLETDKGEVLKSKLALEEELKKHKYQKELQKQYDLLVEENENVKMHRDEARQNIELLKKRCEDLETSLNKRLQLNVQEMKYLKDKVNELEEEKAAKEAELFTLQSDQKIKKGENEEDTGKKITGCGEEIQHLKDELETLEDNYDLLNGQLKVERDAKRECEKALKAKEFEIDELIAEKNDLIQELDKTCLEQNATIEEFNNLLMKNEELMIKDKECREKHLNTDAADKSREVAELGEEIASLKEQLNDECAENAVALKGKDDELKGRIEEINALNERLNELSKMYNDANCKLIELESQSTHDRSNRADYEKRLKNANLEIEKARAQSTEYRIRWEKREAKLEEMFNETSSLEKEKRELEIVVAQYKVNISNLETKIELRNKKKLERDAAIEEAMSRLENENKELEETIARLEDENNTFRAGVRMMMMDNGLLV